MDGASIKVTSMYRKGEIVPENLIIILEKRK